jgi:hypothetical protein
MNTTSTTINNKNNSNNSNNNKKCIVYSLGGNNQWSFELDLLQQTNCEVHTFDCTGNITRFTPIPNHERMCFFIMFVLVLSLLCLPFPSINVLFNILNVVKHGRYLKCNPRYIMIILICLKMDVEGYEWPIFKSWQAMAWENDDDDDDEGISKNHENKNNKNNENTDNSWSLPHQMMVEIHHFTQKPWETVALVEMLMQMGYVVIRADNNIYCPKCAEFALLRIRCPAVGH